MDKVEFDDVVEDINTAELSDDFDFEPVENGSFRFGVFQLVGHGSVTSDRCGRFSSFWGCLRVDLHNRITLSGESFRGKVYVRKVFHSCDKPSCPVCFKFGWAVREAGRIEVRLAEAGKRFGQVEHIVATVPPKFYGLSYEVLRRKVVKVLSDRGVIGGVLIFHGFRYNLRRWWYYSPHFHVLGFIAGGYRCRGCKKCFRGCGGFVDRNYRCYEKDGCIVRVMGRRKTVGGTAWYQLNHSSVDVSKKRFHVATWFGVVSYRKLKVTVENGFRRNVCPICGHELEKLRYVGNVKEIFCWHNALREKSGKADFFDFYENERGVNWIPDLRSGNYDS